MSISTITLIISEVVALAGIIIPAMVWASRIIEGLRCQLRADMLTIYYGCKDSKQIRQYEAEHFEKCYHAYKALKGNSFIDDIYEKTHRFEIK